MDHGKADELIRRLAAAFGARPSESAAYHLATARVQTGATDRLLAMPVTDHDLDGAAREYQRTLERVAGRADVRGEVG